MKHALLVLCALLDTALLYGACRLFGYKPPVEAIVLVCFALYAASDLFIFSRRKG